MDFGRLLPRSSRATIALPVVGLLVAACAPAAPAAPTSAPLKPAATTAPAPAPTAALQAKPTISAPAKPVATAPATMAPAAQAAAKPNSAGDQATADFYRGKTIRIITGSAPGGTYDTYSRMLARHMPRYVPGNPTIVVEAKPGAGGVLAANTLYNLEPKDGTVIGTFGETLVLRQAMGGQGIEYDAAKFNWLGSAVNTAIACAVRVDAQATSMQDVLAGKPLVLGTLAPGSTIYDTPAIINAALGTDMKLVSGYDGVAKIILATETKEVDGYCASFLSMSSTAKQLLEGDNPVAKVFIIMGDTTPDHPFLKDVPAAETLATTDEARQLLQAIHAPSRITNPYTVAPGVPVERVEALRTAFSATFKDPEFLAEAAKVNIEFTPSTGEQVAQVVQATLNTPPTTLDKLKSILLQ